jgi:RNA polymerase sigma-70 factor (ECF subfamily)
MTVHPEGKNDEGELVRRFRDGDEEAFRVLVEACRDRLEQRIGACLPNRVARRVSVEDVFQESLFVAFERRREFENNGNGSFRRWLTGIAENKVRRAVQRHRDVPKRSIDREVSRNASAWLGNAAGVESTPSQIAVGEEAARLARAAMAELPDDYREVLRLVRHEGLKLREVADRMGRSHAAVRQLHRRALLRFTEIFARLRGDSHG